MYIRRGPFLDLFPFIRPLSEVFQLFFPDAVAKKSGLPFVNLPQQLHFLMDSVQSLVIGDSIHVGDF